MKVHLIKKQSIEEYVLKNARSKVSFELWLSNIKRADWNDPIDILSTFSSADVLGKSSHRVVFDLEGTTTD
jgi:mRNA interferase HigB